MYADLFNEVLGPIMAGPSSSHTAGPARLGHMVHDLCGGIPQHARVYFSASGSYASSYQGQGADRGFAAGLLGFEPDDARVYDALSLAPQMGMDLQFSIVDEPYPHSNSALIACTLADGTHLRVFTASIGGGAIDVQQIDDLPVQLSGGAYELVLWADTSAQALAAAQFGAPTFHNETLCVFSFDHEPDFARARAIDGVRLARLIRPVVPSVVRFGARPPFANARELEAFLREHPMPLDRAAIAYQQQMSGWSEAQILQRCELLLQKMEESVQAGLACDGRGFTYLSPKAKDLQRAQQQGLFLPTGLLDTATVYATAVMEANRSMHTVVAIPTAGSSGVLPAVMLSAQHAGIFTREQCRKGLLVAGLIGLFISHQAAFTGSTGGCAVENGSASAMAAAALCFMAGHDAQTCLRAAGIALQNLIGLACDPVAGGIEIPCIHRNAMAAANAYVCANMAIGGFDPYLPLDEVIVALHEAGKLMAPQLRCMGYGGLAGTPTGRYIADQLHAGCRFVTKRTQ